MSSRLALAAHEHASEVRLAPGPRVGSGRGRTTYEAILRVEMALGWVRAARSGP